MNFLIKLGIILATFLCSLFSSAQVTPNNIYDRFSGKEGFTSVSLSKSEITPLNIFFDDDTKEVIAKIDRFRFLSYNETNGKLFKGEVFDKISDCFNSSGFFTIDQSELNCRNCPHWNDNDIKLWGKGSRSLMTEFHLLAIENNSCFLFSFFGNISIDDIEKCADFSNTAKINLSIHK